MDVPNHMDLVLSKAVVRYTRLRRNDIFRGGLLCPDCQMFPHHPVTGHCGHTRCYRCVLICRNCICGSLFLYMNRNILIQRLLNKIEPYFLVTPRAEQPVASTSTLSPVHRQGRLKSRSPCAVLCKKRSHPYLPDESHRRYGILGDPSKQYEYAKAQVTLRKYDVAGAHFACVAASDNEHFAEMALRYLPIVLREIMESKKVSDFSEELHAVFRTAITGSQQPSLGIEDIECVICLESLENPVTTPCGHTFCRKCVVHSLEYDTKKCAICRRPLQKLSMELAGDTKYINTAMLLLGPTPTIEFVMGRPPEVKADDSVIPIFICITAFPSIPCPILMLRPPNSNAIRQILDSGRRMIGLVAKKRDGTFAECGTLVEVRDCVQLADGNTILSTIGIHRFMIKESVYHNRCHLARVEEIIDDLPEDSVTAHLEYLSMIITNKFYYWLLNLSASFKAQLEQAYGPLPLSTNESQWWKNPHSPKWLWWIIAVLPLRTEFRIMLLSTKSLLKRMQAISCILNSYSDSIV